MIARAPPVRASIRRVPGQASVRAGRAPAHGPEPVGVARAGHHRRRPDQDLAVDVPGEVDARGTAARDRGRGRSASARGGGAGDQPQVGAAEGDDPRVAGRRRRRRPAGRPRRPRRRRRGRRSCPRGRGSGAARRRSARRPCTSQPVRPSRPPRRCPRASARATPGKSTIPVAGECRPAIPRAWGSSSLDLAGVDPRRSPRTPLARPRRSSSAGARARRLGREDELAAALAGDPVAFAVLVHLPRPFHAQPCLQRARRVVDTGVDDAGVVSRLVARDLGLALEHADRGRGRRASSSRATARPTMPPPTTAMSQLSGACSAPGIHREQRR